MPTPAEQLVAQLLGGGQPTSPVGNAWPNPPMASSPWLTPSSASTVPTGLPTAAPIGAGWNPGSLLRGSPGAATGGLGAVEGAAAGAAGAAPSLSLLGRLKAVGPGPMEGALGSTAARGIAGIGGSIVGGLASQALGPTTAAGKFAQGAGAAGGLAYGLTGNPLVGLAGAGVGGLISMLGLSPFSSKSPSTPDLHNALVAAVNAAPLDAATRAQILSSYDVSLAAATTDAEKKAAATQAANLVTSIIQQQAAAKQQSANALAMQGVIADYMQPYAQGMTQSAQAQYGLVNQLADQLPDAYKPIARLQAAQGLTSANRTASAYMMQASLLPAMQGAQAQQSYASQVNQQAQAQAIAAQSGQGAGAVDFGAILAAQGVQP